MTPAAKPNLAYLLLGSNIGAEGNIPAAVDELSRYGRILALSSVWESAAVGDVDQPNFLNAAVLLATEFSARDLRNDAITEIERLLGRIRDAHNVNAARTIDVDLSLFNREIFTLNGRTVPDPDILIRPFIAVPLAELDPDYQHPTDGRTLQQIARSLLHKQEKQRLELRPDVQIAVEEFKSPFRI